MIEQVVDQQSDGVDRALGHGGVAAPAMGREQEGPVRGRLDVDAVRRRQLISRGADEGRGLAGHRVAHRAAVELEDAVAHHMPRSELASIEALFAADQREVGVRREAEGRLRVPLQVPVHIGHRGLLVVADDATQRVGQSLPRPLDLALEKMCSIKREDEGTLVIQHAAADQVAVLARDREGVEVPAQALGHDIGVRDGRNLHVRLAREVRVADVPVAIMGVEPQAGGYADGCLERLVGRGAPGHARDRGLLVLDRADADQPVDIGDHVLPHLVDVGVYLLLELLISHRDPQINETVCPTMRLDQADLPYTDSGYLL